MGVAAVLGACGGRDISLGNPNPAGDGPGEAGAGTVPEAGATAPNGGDATPAPVTTRPGCTTLPTTPQSLGFPSPTGTAYALAPASSKLLVSISDDTPKFSVFGVPLPNGSPAVAEIDQGAPPVFLDGQSIVYRRYVATSTGPQSWAFSYPEVVVRTAGNDLTLPNPPGTKDVLEVAMNPTGQVFWITWNENQTGGQAISRWDPTTQATDVIAHGDDFMGLYADDAAIYWMSVTSRIEIDSLPFASGTIVTLLSSPAAINAGSPRLQGQDATKLYFTNDGDSAGVLYAISKTGGQTQTVATLGAQLLYPLVADDTHLYWADYGDQSALRRMPRGGGPIETISALPNRYVQALTVDACNVYWSIVNPDEIFGRGK
jgi:hypothetical protein